jgi:ribosome-associated translation inhibitor RaiA
VGIEVAQENDAVKTFKLTAVVHLDGADNEAFTANNADAYAGVNELQEKVLRSLRRAKRLKVTQRHQSVEV